jgi:hypothetical protein
MKPSRPFVLKTRIPDGEQRLTLDLALATNWNHLESNETVLSGLYPVGRAAIALLGSAGDCHESCL